MGTSVVTRGEADHVRGQGVENDDRPPRSDVDRDGHSARGSAGHAAVSPQSARPEGGSVVRLVDLASSAAGLIDAVGSLVARSGTVHLVDGRGESLVITQDSDAARLIAFLVEAQGERVTASGREAARALGRPGGRPTVIDQPRRVQIGRLLTARGRDGRPLYSYAEIAQKTGVSRSTIARHAGSILASLSRKL